MRYAPFTNPGVERRIGYAPDAVRRVIIAKTEYAGEAQ